jgi:hypothetical protein
MVQSVHTIDYARNIISRILLYSQQKRGFLSPGHCFQTGSGAIQEPSPMVSMSKATGREGDHSSPSCDGVHAWSYIYRSGPRCM